MVKGCHMEVNFIWCLLEAPYFPHVWYLKLCVQIQGLHSLHTLSATLSFWKVFIKQIHSPASYISWLSLDGFYLGCSCFT